MGISLTFARLSPSGGQVGYALLTRAPVDAYIDCSFPDYTTPLFSDNRFREREELMPYYRAWAEVFPANAAIRWMATEGREGTAPEHLSRALRTSVLSMR